MPDTSARRVTAWLAPRLPALLVVVTVAVISVITMAISYEHEYLLARRNGQLEWVAGLVPFSVDGILLVASVALYWAGRNGVRRPWRPLVVGAVGILATIAANMFSDLQFRWLGPAVAASSGLALVLISWVAFWLVSEMRKLTPGYEPQPAADCSCPPPPADLAEALPAVRAERKRRQLPYGEQALADALGTSRHQVRMALAPQVDVALTNGHSHA